MHLDFPAFLGRRKPAIWLKRWNFAGHGGDACNTNTRGAEAGGSGVLGQPGFHSETPSLNKQQSVGILTVTFPPAEFPNLPDPSEASGA
jgi:hypothetical protein